MLFTLNENSALPPLAGEASACIDSASVIFKHQGLPMSDKFFFKGRQDSRQHHTQLGYQTNHDHKAGTKKFPLKLTVTSEARKQEVETLVAEAELFAEVSVDSREGAIESIETLTALLNKGETVKVEKVPARNEPCSCGSGKKYKKCCG